MVSARKGLARLALAAVQLACKLAHAARTVQCGAVQRARASSRGHARGHAGSRQRGLAHAASNGGIGGIGGGLAGRGGEEEAVAAAAFTAPYFISQCLAL